MPVQQATEEERVIALNEFMRRSCGVKELVRYKDTVYAVYERIESQKKRRRITHWCVSENEAIAQALWQYVLKERAHGNNRWT